MYRKCALPDESIIVNLFLLSCLSVISYFLLQEAVIGGWQLIRQAGDSEATFRFHRSVKIEPGSIITVWSSDAGQTHEPPTNIVMKTQKWVVGEVMTTALMNPQGEVRPKISVMLIPLLINILSLRHFYSI